MNNPLLWLGISAAFFIFAWISYELYHAMPVDKDGRPLRKEAPTHKLPRPYGIGKTVHPDKPIKSFTAWQKHIHKQVCRGYRAPNSFTNKQQQND
jgi:hypothetical protein